VIRDLERCRAGARVHPWGGSDAFDRVRIALTLRSLRRALPQTRSLDVLEIGFGRGLLLSRLLREGHRATGVDPGALERDLDRTVRSRATILAQPAESLDLPEASFDLVYGIHVVEHLSDPAAVLRTCRRVLRPGGLLYLMTPNADSMGLRLFREAWWNLEDPTHVRFFTPRSISTMLRTAGFERGRSRVPLWDSQSIEISSLIRMVRPAPGPHGVLGSKALFPLYAALLPFSLLVRVVWPALSPSMEVLAWKGLRTGA
jgi:SAM-dependent methyltransferase